MAGKAATLRIALPSKRVGAEETTMHRMGTRCRVERSGLCLGEFLIWFPNRHYAKVNAVDLHNTVRFINEKGVL